LKHKRFHSFFIALSVSLGIHVRRCKQIILYLLKLNIVDSVTYLCLVKMSGLKVSIEGRQTEEAAGENSNDPSSNPETPPIMTTTNSYNSLSNVPPIHICCYRSRHVQLCGKSTSLGE